MRGRAWTAEDERRLRRHYPDQPTWRIAQTLGRSERAVYNKARQLGLTKSAAFHASPASGRIRPGGSIGGATRFRPGHTPWNKGLKGYDAGGRSAQTRFKPGHLAGVAAARLKPLGAERIMEGIRQRKIRMDGPPHRRWKSVHSLLWEERHGPIPPGHVVIFIDGDRSNITIDNLALVSRAELAVLNKRGWNNLPAELRTTAIATVRLEQAARMDPHHHRAAGVSDRPARAANRVKNAF